MARFIRRYCPKCGALLIESLTSFAHCTYCNKDYLKSETIIKEEE